ncbi:GABA transporter 1 isoform X2 [Jatropha curcas]|uniref:GABA transporter 1 isoform X2 n=1 Tax=Jatropha curcas TaxID=180498 RepID=UPI0018950608|nr:GABA transporter 1 isoform X2 [Jatropha curcas]
MQAIYLLSNPNGNIKLYEFVIIFGCLMLILAQIPSFHSLRHISLISLLLCLAYSACATAGSVHIGNSSKEPKDYSLKGDTQDRVFGFCNAIAIIATTYGNGIIPEIQGLKMLADQLSNIGAPISNQRLVLQLIAGLNENYDGVATFIQ